MGIQDDVDDATGDRPWDSGNLLSKALRDPKTSSYLLSSTPDEVLELGAGTGHTAIQLLQLWPHVTYVATDLPARVPALERLQSAASGSRLRVLPLHWGDAPPALTCEIDSTYVVLLADLIYYNGGSLFASDTLAPLVCTLRLALAQHPQAVAFCTFRERDPLREAHFCRLCVDSGLLVTSPLDALHLDALLPAAEQLDVEKSGSLRLWRIVLSAAT